MTQFGSRLVTELDSQSVAAINSLHPFHSQGSWLESMQRMLHLEGSAS
jgi:hypothetical protein